MSRLPTAFAIALLSAWLSTAASARAQPAVNTTVPPAPDEAPTPFIPPASDSLGGHVLLGAGPGLVFPAGSLDTERDLRDVAHRGLGLGLDAGYGISRSVVVGAWLAYASYGSVTCRFDAQPATDCSTTSFGVGPLIRYHLVQGTRFDPWASLGFGYRSLSIDGPGAPSYSGWEWLRLSVGGDWYALSQVGFGPYLELDLGSYLNPPQGANAGVYVTMATGLRLVFDPAGR